MAERTVGLEVDELLLPEEHLEEYQDAIKPPDEREDSHEMEVDEPNEERAPEKTNEPAKPANGAKKNTGKKSEPPKEVLYKLVGLFLGLSLLSASQPRRSEKPILWLQSCLMRRRTLCGSGELA